MISHLGSIVLTLVLFSIDPLARLYAQSHQIRRRVVRSSTAVWFWDRDGDKWGSRDWAPAPPGGDGASSKVTNCLDCDDLHRNVFVNVASMVPDCNGNHVADDTILTTVCVGNVRSGPPLAGPDGTVIVNLVFADKHGNFWIPIEWAKKDDDGIVVDFEHEACPRM